MYASRIRAAGLAVAATLGLSACSTYGGLGYGGVSVGVGNGGYYDPYGGYGYGYDDYGYGYGDYGGYGGYGYPSYGYGYGYPGSGWHNGYYYPGTGYYVYRDGRRHRWNQQQRRYFETYRQRWHDRAVRERRGERVDATEQSRIRQALGSHRVARPEGQPQVRRNVRTDRPQVRRQVRTDRPQERRVVPTENRQQRAAARAETRQERRATSAENRQRRAANVQAAREQWLKRRAERENKDD